MFDVEEHTHTRLNILIGDWVLVSPYSIKYPWQVTCNRISVLQLIEAFEK